MSETVTWSYDDPTIGRFGVGRLTSSTDPVGDVSYSYERRGLLREETRNITALSQTHTTSYAYDADGNRNGITYPSGLYVEYVFDHAGRPVNATGAVAEASYLPFGPLNDLKFQNGTRQFMSYDARYRMTNNDLYSSSVGRPFVLASYVYDYDDAGNVTGIRDYRDATYDRGFEYDDLNRLTVANTGSSLWQTGSYSWDAMGNLETMSLGTLAGRSSTLVYDGTTPKLTSVTSNNATHNVEYDAAGNETSYLATRSYSPRNLTEEVLRSHGSSRRMHNTYDGRGIRIVSETQIAFAPPTAQAYLYSPELQLMAVTAPNSAAIEYEIVWFAGRPVAQITPATGAARYTFTDHLATPILQTGDSPTVIWRAEYEPFGNVFKMRTGTSTDQPLRFPGQEVAFNWEGQEENYNIFRWYRSGWGRYSQADPIGLDGGTNVFLYTLANPLALTDPLGLDTAGCDQYMGKFENPCEKECCAAHDKCYDDYNCSSGSWGSSPKCGCDQTKECKTCNKDALGCFGLCSLKSGIGSSKKPNYYCAKLHKYIDIPKDFPTYGAAIKACEYDQFKECKIPLAPSKPVKKPWYKKLF